MNANEVIANRGLELLGHGRGEYRYLHPVEDVNMSQSTNDVYPTAVKVALHFAIDRLGAAMRELRRAFGAKALEFTDVLKMGRTQLQDAVPMTLGQEFTTYAVMLEEDEERLREAALLITEINLGATAIGTGINAHPDYAALVCQRRVVGVGVDAGADCGRPQIDLGDKQRRLPQALLVLLEHHGVGGEFLAERHRHGVLELRAPHLQHVGELQRLGAEGTAQLLHGRAEAADREVQRHLDGGRIDVVGALAHVDVFDRVQIAVLAAPVAEQLEPAVGDDFVGVHVGRGPRPALDDVNDELVEQLALADLLAGSRDRFGFVVGEQSEAIVRERRRLLDAGERAHELRVDGDRRPSDTKVLQRAQRVDAVVGVGGDRPVAQEIVLDARRRLAHVAILLEAEIEF